MITIYNNRKITPLICKYIKSGMMIILNIYKKMPSIKNI